MGKYCYFSAELWLIIDVQIAILLNIWRKDTRVARSGGILQCLHSFYFPVMCR